MRFSRSSLRHCFLSLLFPRALPRHTHAPCSHAAHPHTRTHIATRPSTHPKWCVMRAGEETEESRRAVASPAENCGASPVPGPSALSHTSVLLLPPPPRTRPLHLQTSKWQAVRVRNVALPIPRPLYATWRPSRMAGACPRSHHQSAPAPLPALSVPHGRRAWEPGRLWVRTREQAECCAARARPSSARMRQQLFSRRPRFGRAYFAVRHTRTPAQGRSLAHLPGLHAYANMLACMCRAPWPLTAPCLPFSFSPTPARASRSRNLLSLSAASLSHPARPLDGRAC